MDHFVRGEEVSVASLRHVWLNTTQLHFAMDLPIYEEFFTSFSRPHARTLIRLKSAKSIRLVR